MIELPKYNPCEKHVLDIKLLLDDKLVSNKDIIIKYDNKKFISNLKMEDLKKSFCCDEIITAFNHKGFLFYTAEYEFFKDFIAKCPFVTYIVLDNLYLDGILKRMYSQIEFKFYNENPIESNHIDICDNIFKSIYSKSAAIKLKNIEQSLEKYDIFQKEGYLSKSIISGIIYSVYDYYSLLESSINN